MATRIPALIAILFFVTVASIVPLVGFIALLPIIIFLPYLLKRP